MALEYLPCHPSGLAFRPNAIRGLSHPLGERHPALHQELGVYYCPSASVERLSEVNYGEAIREPVRTSYTYNGLLHELNQAMIVSPSTLPVAWEGRGKASVEGFALTNPSLRCVSPNRPCRYFSCTNGVVVDAYLLGVMFNLDGTLWVHSQGAIFIASDGSAKWRRLGAQLAPNHTDWRTDPYTQYNAQGFPQIVWWDGCNPWLFRPDYDPNESRGQPPGTACENCTP